MKQIIKKSLCLFIMMVLLTGCTTYKSVKFDVETGDKVTIKLKTNGGYSISAEVPFKITKDGKTYTQGTFITLDSYEQYKEAVNNDENAEIIEENDSYIFYSYNNQEYNYIVKLSKGKTAILLGNAESEKSAKEIYENLSFKVK